MIIDPGEWTGYVVDNRYRIGRLLGEGGFGMVFAGEHALFGERIRDVALKVIKSPIPKGREKEVFGEAMLQVKAEAGIMEADARERMVRVIDFGIIEERERRGFIVMELVDGIDLGKEIANFGKLVPENISLQYISSVCEAMAALHALHPPLIHRDLKPENVLLDARKRVKVADFGLAVRLNGVHGWARGVAGTQVYMAPETLLGASCTQSDVFSIGTIWYKMLAGRMPFDDDVPPGGEEDDDTRIWRLNRRRNIVPPSPAAFNNTCSERTAALVLRCLAYRHEDRFKDAGALLAEIRRPQASPAESAASAESALKRGDFAAVLAFTKGGAALPPAGKDAEAFRLRLATAKAMTALGRLEEADRLFFELRQENDRFKWMFRPAELLDLYESEIRLHEKRGNAQKARILRKTVLKFREGANAH